MSVANFLAIRSAWLGDGGQPVTPELAQARANVCLKCPKNKKMGFYEGVAKPVAHLLRRQIELKSQMLLSVEGEDKLHVCDVCGCILKLKIHCPIKYIEETTPDEDIPKFDPMCWIPKEIAVK